ncbi:MAG TPA: respiratory nitrate reductase subunit gamma [Geobacteraceae bacterium]|nr:respiratory nitrate reductase subunit gamma [Geobacteraceae bacterium]
MNFAIGSILPYLAFAVFLCGTVLRIADWFAKPVPFQLTLFPAPRGKLGGAAAVLREFVFCNTLFRENRLLWVWVWSFHLSLVMIIAGHVLGIYFLRSQFSLFGAAPGTSAVLSVTLGATMGTVMTVSLIALLCRRIFIPETRKLSEPLAWFDLMLLLAVALSGLAMYLPGYHADLVAVRTFMKGLLTLHPEKLPTNPVFVIHFSLVIFLVLYFPFSQLIHSAGFFINRAMLAEAAPVFPTPAGKGPRSPFAGIKHEPGKVSAREDHAAGEVRHQ